MTTHSSIPVFQEEYLFQYSRKYTYSSILAWGICLGTEEPGGLQSMGSERVGYDLANK